MIPQKTYDFGPAYQTKLLALACRDPAFLAANRDLIEPRWFENPIHCDLARMACAYYDKRGQGPTLAAMSEAVSDLLATDRKRAERAPDFQAALAALAGPAPMEADDVRDRAGVFAKRQALVAAIMEAADDIDAGRLDEAADKVDKARMVGGRAAHKSLDYFADLDRFSAPRSKRTLATGLPLLDAYLYGGLAQGEMGVVEAPPGRFKTGTLVNFGTAALKRGATVVHCTLEMSAEAVGRRYDGCLIGIPSQTQRPPAELEAELRAWSARISGRLLIEEWPSCAVTAEMVRAMLHRRVLEGRIEPNAGKLLVIVDYGQIMAAPRHYEDKRHEQRENYLALRRIAQEFGCPLWTAAQSNRGSVNKGVIGIQDLSECFAIAMDSDVILALSQTKDEEDRKFLRIVTAKVRDAQSFQEVPCRVDYDLARLHPEESPEPARLPVGEAKPAPKGPRRVSTT